MLFSAVLWKTGKQCEKKDKNKNHKERQRVREEQESSKKIKSAATSQTAKMKEREAKKEAGKTTPSLQVAAHSCTACTVVCVFVCVADRQRS